jgi:glutamine amidotransferase
LIVILDYGMGNLRSVERAVRHLGFECSIQPDLAGASKLILPGVGAFGAAMQRLGPMVGAIREFAASGRPVMGICLGQQLLFDLSEEMGSHEGSEDPARRLERASVCPRSGTGRRFEAG